MSQKLFNIFFVVVVEKPFTCRANISDFSWLNTPFAIEQKTTKEESNGKVEIIEVGFVYVRLIIQ